MIDDTQMDPMVEGEDAAPEAPAMGDDTAEEAPVEAPADAEETGAGEVA